MQSTLVLDTPWGQVSLVNEPTYTFGSADNARRYDAEFAFDRDRPSSIHGVCVEGRWRGVFGGSGGATGVHAHSAVARAGKLYLGVSRYVACVDLATRTLAWSRRVDPATCFGVHWAIKQDALIAHGEMMISRFSPGGDELWSRSGADIFTGKLHCLADAVEVVDFQERVYRFDYVTGEQHSGAVAAMPATAV
jgi:hypothetical protein